MSELSCLQCRGLAAELALNIVTGRERGTALAHLGRCCPCRRRVAELAQTADQLVELLPEVEPPAGFEQRTAAALAEQHTAAALAEQQRHPRRPAVPVTTILLAIALAAGGSALGFHSPASTGASPVSTGPPDDGRAGNRMVLYAPLTYEQRLVGQAYLYPGSPSWIYVSVDYAESGVDRVECEVISPNGSAVPVATIPLRQGRGAWGGPTNITPEDLRTTALVSPHGRTVATGRFNPPQRPAPLPLRPEPQPDRSAPAVDPSDGAPATLTTASQPGKPGRDWDRDRAHRPDRDKPARSGPDRDRPARAESEAPHPVHTNAPNQADEPAPRHTDNAKPHDNAKPNRGPHGGSLPYHRPAAAPSRTPEHDAGLEKARDRHDGSHPQALTQRPRVSDRPDADERDAKAVTQQLTAHKPDAPNRRNAKGTTQQLTAQQPDVPNRRDAKGTAQQLTAQNEHASSGWRGDQARGDQARSDQARGDKARGDQARTQQPKAPAQRDAPDRKPDKEGTGKRQAKTTNGTPSVSAAASRRN
jgi:hypothetical protein